MHPPLPACYAAKNNNTPRKNFLGVSVSPIFPSSYEIYPSVPRSPPSSSSSSVDWAEEEEKSFVRFSQGKTKLFPFLRSPSKGDERNKLISLSTPPLLCGGRYTWAGSMGVSPPVGPAPTHVRSQTCREGSPDFVLREGDSKYLLRKGEKLFDLGRG